MNKIDGSWRKGQQEKGESIVSTHAILSRMVGGDRQEEVTLRQRTEGGEKATEISGESVLGRGTSQCKGPGVRVCLVSSKDWKEA